MINYYVTETLEEAQAHEASDFIEFYNANPALPAEYWLTTIVWSIPVQRLDGKWVRSVSPTSTATNRTIETKDSSWFPSIEG